MRKKQKTFYALVIVSALAIVCFVTVFYIRQLNMAVSDNTIRAISEMAEHDKSAIQSYINICWQDLEEIRQRLACSDCQTAGDIEAHLSLECASSSFTHIYLLAEDGTVYTDIPATPSGTQAAGQSPDFLSYFGNGRERIVARFDPVSTEGQLSKENILYGIRLKDFELEGIPMYGLIGINDISSIQDKMVIDSFIKNGESRGHSALIDRDGNYIVNINKEIYLNSLNNLYEHLRESTHSELTNEEVAEKMAHSETFGFYHSHAGERYKELFYFIPFEDDFNLYFIMSVNEAVFAEQSNTFVTLSITTLILSMLIVVAMLLVVMNYQIKIIRTTEAARSQKEFLSNMSHEIRTPLNGLIGMNHLIMVHIDDDSQKPQIREWLRKSHSTANYLLSLVNDILDMSKLQAGKVDLINEPFSVTMLVDEIAAMQMDNITGRGVAFTVEKDLAEPYISGDETRIKQILMNIVGNAAKFTPEGGSIRLTATQEKTDDTHVITTYCCQDTGIGMSKEYLGRIFDTFSQERSKHTSGTRGTGLGMAISKRLANAMGGDIHVESQLQVGSTFTVTIPSTIVADIPDYLLEPSQEPAEEIPPAPSDLQEQGRPVKILVAEDVELNAEVLLEILAMEGFETVHASDGLEALNLFQQSAVGEFDIILMDMQMPVMDGCTASREIRRLDRADASTVVIYACTANTFQEDRKRALENGMNDFLAKPIDVNILLKKIGKSRK